MPNFSESIKVPPPREEEPEEEFESEIEEPYEDEQEPSYTQRINSEEMSVPSSNHEEVSIGLRNAKIRSSILPKLAKHNSGSRKFINPNVGSNEFDSF